MVTPPKGDYASVPISAEGRRVADTWDPVKDERDGNACRAYGAAAILQELLTVKSDDVDGRTKIYESMVKGVNILEPGTPVSFEVLTNEIKGLALNM